jgi:hypothetical protein
MSFIGLKATGIEEVKTQLRYAATKVPDNARKIMHRAADKIVQESKLNAPVDDGELEDSIHKEIGYEGRGRLKIDIVAGGVIRGVDVDRYAVIIHENYEGTLKKGPGKNTIAKMMANPGRIVGSKFIQRAVDKQRPKLMAAMIAASNVGVEK